MKVLTSALVCTALFLSACSEVSSTPQKVTQSQKAAAAANSIQFSENSEIENITRRLKLTSNPGQIGFILLMNEMGQPVMYSSVKGKITSGSKRLTSPEKHELVGGDYELATAPSDEGTYGSSDPYIYFWDTNGQYVQWNGKYLYSDKPIRVRIEPLVIKSN